MSCRHDSHLCHEFGDYSCGRLKPATRMAPYLYNNAELPSDLAV